GSARHLGAMRIAGHSRRLATAAADAARPCFAPLGAPAREPDLAQLAAFVGQGRLAVLTGAGFSTESGIPDYRSPEGSYSKGHKPMTHQEFLSSE
ncbi:unnamed protein product, partial [Effrenium voratum]